MAISRKRLDAVVASSPLQPLSLDLTALHSLAGPIIQNLCDRMKLLEAVIEDRQADHVKRRHDQNGKIEYLENKAYLFGERMIVLEHRMQAIDGGDTGTGGLLCKLEQVQARLEQTTSDVKSDLRSLRDSGPSSPQLQEMQAWKNKWRGVAVAVSIAGTLFALISGVIAALWTVFHHLN